MNREQLLKQRRELMAKMHEMNARCAAFSADDQTAWDNLLSQVRAIDAQLARLDELDALQGSGEQPVNEQRSATPPANEPPAGGTRTATHPAQPPVDPAAERARCLEITEMCKNFGIDADVMRGYIEQGTPVDQVRKAVLAELAQRNAPVPGAPRVSVGEENVDKFREQGADAIIMRSGLDITKATRERGQAYKPVDGAHELRHMGLHEMMREYCQLRGVQNVNRLSIDDLRREVFTPDSQFAAMLDNVVNKSMLIGYQDAGVTFDVWTSTGSNPDFKPTRRYRLSEAGTPSKILQNGEFRHDVMSDQRVQLQLETYGIMFTLSRQAIINDDLSYLTQMPAAYVRGFRRLINRNVYGLLNNNTAYQVDNVALFASEHGNLAATPAYPSTGALGLARAAMRKQRNVRGDEYLNIAPRFVLTGPDLETDMEKLLMSFADPDGTNSNVVNPFRGKLQLVTDAELTSATDNNPDWFLAADPSLVNTIEVAYLNGNSLPTLESQISFEQLGMAWRVYGDWDIDILDYRGLYKVPGAAAA